MTNEVFDLADEASNSSMGKQLGRHCREQVVEVGRWGVWRLWRKADVFIITVMVLMICLGIVETW